MKSKALRGIKLGLTIFTAALVGIFLGHLVSSYELRFMLTREYCGTFRGIEIYKSGDINEENFTQHAYMLSIAPDRLVECCDRMYFTGSDLDIPANDSGFTSALGLTQDRTIYISTEGFGKDVVFHELFHAYDNASGTPSAKSPDFLSAYNAENTKIRVTTGYEALHAAEYYAQAGAVFLVSPAELKALAPLTYDYFYSIFGSFPLKE